MRGLSLTRLGVVVDALLIFTHMNLYKNTSNRHIALRQIIVLVITMFQSLANEAFGVALCAFPIQCEYVRCSEAQASLE